MRITCGFRGSVTNPRLVNYARQEPDLVKAVKFGEGFIDYRAFFQGLTDGGFDGIANYEMCSPIRGGGAMHKPRPLRETVSSLDARKRRSSVESLSRIIH